MISLNAQPRKEQGRKVAKLRASALIPAVLYGAKIPSTPIQIQGKEFASVYKEAGESTLVFLKMEGSGETSVLIHDIQNDPVSGKVLHVDFYQPDLTKAVTVDVPLVFKGDAPAVIDLGGTFIRNVQSVEVRALPQDLPHEIVVELSSLKTFDDHIMLGSLSHAANVEILGDAEEMVAQVVPPVNVEEELEKTLKAPEEESTETPAVTPEAEPTPEAGKQTKE